MVGCQRWGVLLIGTRREFVIGAFLFKRLKPEFPDVLRVALKVSQDDRETRHFRTGRH